MYNHPQKKWFRKNSKTLYPGKKTNFRNNQIFKIPFNIAIYLLGILLRKKARPTYRNLCTMFIAGLPIIAKIMKRKPGYPTT